MQSSPLRIMRVLGALALLAVGAVHLQQYAGGGYDAIPTIGPLFLLWVSGKGVPSGGFKTMPVCPRTSLLAIVIRRI